MDRPSARFEIARAKLWLGDRKAGGTERIEWCGFAFDF